MLGRISTLPRSCTQTEASSPTECGRQLQAALETGSEHDPRCFPCRAPERRERAKDRHRRVEQDAEGQRPALVERGNKENEKQRYPEDDRRRDALLRPLLLESNLYSQIGLVMLTDNKSAILIVEFAKLARERGTPLLEAALEGACLRLRPIIMTSFAFILGCVPLWTASGSDAVAGRVERFADRRGERAAQDAVRAGAN